MGIGAVVIRPVQAAGDVHKYRPGHILRKSSEHGLVIHGQVAAAFAQVVALVRHDGHENITAGGLQVLFVQVAEPVQGVGHRFGIVGIFLLHRKAVGNIDIVVVLLAQHIIVEQGLDLPEAVPERELIQGIVLKFGHEFAVQQAFQGNFRQLGQGTALRFGNFRLRSEPGEGNQGCPDGHNGDNAKGSDFLIHTAAPLRNGNTGRG